VCATVMQVRGEMSIRRLDSILAEDIQVWLRLWSLRC
jgi:hypothetical protein